MKKWNTRDWYCSYKYDDNHRLIQKSEFNQQGLAISLGGDADTLAAIAGPMAYAYYKTMPDALVFQAMKKLPDWMLEVSERFDAVVNAK